MSAKALPANELPCPELKVVIICEDLECGKYAKELQDQLLSSLQSRIAFVPEVWTFRALQHGDLQTLAHKEIREADLILFSIRGDKEVPPFIKAWLESRLAEPGQPRALVALFGPGKTPAQISATRHYLETIADKACLELFVEQYPKTEIDSTFA